MREKVLNTQKLERIVITPENLKTGWEKVAMDLTAQKMIFRNDISINNDLFLDESIEQIITKKENVKIL